MLSYEKKTIKFDFMVLCFYVHTINITYRPIEKMRYTSIDICFTHLIMKLPRYPQKLIYKEQKLCRVAGKFSQYEYFKYLP